jgi:RNA polymerase sigma-70 factor, ECF subfamily
MGLTDVGGKHYSSSRDTLASMTVENEPSNSLSPEVVERLVKSHRQFLAFLEKRVESRAVAEDILQSAFVRGLERGGELRDEESAVAWFYRVLRNATIDHYRHRASTERAYEGWGKEVITHEAPGAHLEQEICECVVALVETLKPEYREALRIIDIQEGSLKDLAEKYGTTPGNAAVRIHRAREALRKQVRIACGSCAEHGCLDCQCKPQGSAAGCHPPMGAEGVGGA